MSERKRGRLPRIRGRAAGEQVQDEVASEIEYHLDRLTEEFMAQGMDEERARAAAERRFGDVATAQALLAEESLQTERQARRAELFGELRQDVRYGVRTLLRNPVFAIAAVLTLALGIGANTGMFAVAYGVLFRPLPYPDADKLVLVWQNNTLEGDVRYPFSGANYRDLEERNRTLERLGGYSGLGEPTLTGEGAPERVKRVAVYGDFFRVVGVQAALGRTLVAADEAPDAEVVAVLSDGFWQRRFGGDRNVLGKKIEMWGQTATIVGVLPPGFTVPTHETVDVVTAGRFQPEFWTVRARHSLNLIGRVKPGVTVEQARAELNGIMADLERTYPDTNKGMQATVLTVRDALVGDVRPTLLVLLGAVALVLLVACANIANLLLARASGRERELGIRAALGATRMRLARQLLTESAVLATVGALLGVVLAAGIVRAVRALGPATLPLLGNVELSGRVHLFTLAATGVTALLIGALPALRAVASHFAALRENTRGSSAGRARHHTRRTLVVVQVAMSLVLLTSAGLLLRSYRTILAVDPGIETERVLTFTLVKMGDEAARRQFYQQLEPQLAGVPGVASVGAVSVLPLTVAGGRAQVGIEGHSWGDRKPPEVRWRSTTPSYFSTVGISLASGRLFEPQDASGSARPLIINREMAKRVFGARDPLGLRVTLGPPPQTEFFTIIGVVEDARNVSLTEDVQPEVFVLHAQMPGGGMTMVLRTTVPPVSLLPAVRAQVSVLDPSIFVGDVRTTAELVAATVAQPRFMLYLLLSFAALGVLLAVVGTYGVLAYLVAQRRREIGIRIALGAQRADVLRMVVGEGAVLAVAGIGAGIVAALLFTRVLQGMLFGVSATDPATFAATAALLAAVTLVACWVPARAATRIEVNQALWRD